MNSISIKRSNGTFSRRSAGLAGVVIFHALLIYALVTGLAQGVVKVIQQKVEVSVELHIKPNKDATYAPVAMVLAESQRLGLTKLGIVGSEQFLQ
ncbi:hypothetical protein [Chromobacterium phragmitis]|uniref:hypothetical protein n=1 Tax=Chromobacterium phragmitis TaxID=2202141 RepID=UPI003262D5AD